MDSQCTVTLQSAHQLFWEAEVAEDAESKDSNAGVNPSVWVGNVALVSPFPSFPLPSSQSGWGCCLTPCLLLVQPHSGVLEISVTLNFSSPGAMEVVGAIGIQDPRTAPQFHLGNTEQHFPALKKSFPGMVQPH